MSGMDTIRYQETGRNCNWKELEWVSESKTECINKVSERKKRMFPMLCVLCVGWGGAVASSYMHQISLQHSTHKQSTCLVSMPPPFRGYLKGRQLQCLYHIWDKVPIGIGLISQSHPILSPTSSFLPTTTSFPFQKKKSFLSILWCLTQSVDIGKNSIGRHVCMCWLL